MYDLVITGARLADDRLVDLAVKDGKIAEVGQLADDVHAHRRLDLAGNCRLSAGWIDSHVHCYPSSPIYHTNRTWSGRPVASPRWWMPAAPAPTTWMRFIR